FAAASMQLPRLLANGNHSTGGVADGPGFFAHSLRRSFENLDAPALMASSPIGPKNAVRLVAKVRISFRCASVTLPWRRSIPAATPSLRTVDASLASPMRSDTRAAE